MMKRRLLAFLGAALAVAVLLPAIALTQGSPRPDLVVSFATEPPAFEIPGGRWQVSFTVSNSGRGDAERSTQTRAYLSAGRKVGTDDIALRGTRSIPPLPSDGQATRRVTVNIPPDIPRARYYLIVCADDTDRVTESNDRHNCSLSGQEVSIGISVATGRGPQGPPGPPGPPGPAGDRGARGADGRDSSRPTFTIPRTVVEAGVADVDDPDDSDNSDNFEEANGETVPDEGSTTARDLITVGPVTFRAICRDPPPGPGNPDPAEQEAKIVIRTDSGSMSFEGATGPRGSVPAGFGTAGQDGSDGGEGRRQILATSRTEDEGFGTANEGLVSGFQADTAYIAHSSGAELVFDGYAGVDTLAAGQTGNNDDDKCVFGGSVTLVAPGES